MKSEQQKRDCNQIPYETFRGLKGNMSRILTLLTMKVFKEDTKYNIIF